MTIFDSTVDSVFFPSSTQSAQLEGLSQRALNSGLEAYVAKKYDEAISHFKRAVGLAPASSTAINAYDYMARSYIAQGDNRTAIDTYKQSLRADPGIDSTHTALANLYYSDGRYAEARVEYEQAVKINPSAANRYSLGQGYLANGQYAEAGQQFQKVHDMAPLEPNGDFGLGQTYARQGRSNDAISAFQRALDLQPDFLDAYSEMGYVLADSGDMGRAQEIADLLKARASPLADTLNQYIYEQSAPRMTAAYNSDILRPFLTSLGPRTPVTTLGGDLYQAGGQQTLSIIFQFDKPMDRQTVENTLNWRIGRDTGTGHGDGYNFGYTPPASEITLPASPMAVIYDSGQQTATVLFKVTQNSTANGTLDPSHIKFSFNGKDASGLAMASNANDYTGFSGFA